MTLWPTVAEQISTQTGIPFVVGAVHPQGGGCISATYVVEDGQRRYFVKVNDAHRSAMFTAEAAGLAELARPRCLRIPTPITVGVSGQCAFLVLEYLDLDTRNHTGMAQMGRGLALLHRTTQDHFGWCMDNTLGATPQHNPETKDWVSFWGKYRLGFQLDLAHSIRRGEELLAKLPAFFTDYRPRPSLVHGDLWRGNAALTRTGEPALFDPAVYYGDREVDLAMTELFGGFDAHFYAAYREAWPLDSGYSVRKQLYNLYHILNHFVLFGGSYRNQAIQMVDTLLAELG